MKFWIKKNSFGEIEPCDTVSAETMSFLKTDKCYLFEAKSPRNVQHHRKYFALLNAVRMMQDEYTNIEVLRSLLLIRIGYFDSYFDDGKYFCLSKSISFSRMSQEEFEDVYNKSIDAAVNMINEINATDYNSKDVEDMIDYILNFA